MMLYQYECLACGKVTEEMRAVEDRKSGPTCACGAQAVHVDCPRISGSGVLGADHGAEATFGSQTEPGTSAMVSGPTFAFKDCHFQGGHTGIKMPGPGRLITQNTTFKDVKVAIDRGRKPRRKK